ncbi:MAG: heme oxygenase [Flavobacterium sp.]|uniref:biliverdin-producing heme oxygenase n=1 Tax=Flavobacterium sp. TaxID=239 RepID=UPI001229E340|nr:biliverdin-producing heme oxygenase [Flavobacterium sp.]RZJ65744.1 MAG: heme oxygenase [Flavobacterium sp.]
MNPDTLKAATPESLFIEQLRARTSAAHKSLEQLPVSSSILDPSVTKEQYAHYLQLMYDVVKSLETTIYPLIERIIPNLSDREKSRNIENDLHVLGYQTPDANTTVFSTENLSVPFALGIAYVVEGSTLGGRFILKNIESVLGFDENSGATYFAGYGNKTGSRWKNFLESVTGYAVSGDSSGEIIEGAEFAFNRIGKHLQTRP